MDSGLALSGDFVASRAPEWRPRELGRHA